LNIKNRHFLLDNCVFWLLKSWVVEGEFSNRKNKIRQEREVDNEGTYNGLMMINDLWRKVGEEIPLILQLDEYFSIDK